MTSFDLVHSFLLLVPSRNDNHQTTMEDHNVLTDPGEELRASLISHAFGVDSYDVREEGAGARARVVLLHSEGFVDVLLDSRGYTVCHPHFLSPV